MVVALTGLCDVTVSLHCGGHCVDSLCDRCVTGGTERSRHYPEMTIQQPTATTANNNDDDGLNCCLDHALLPGVVKQTACVNDWSSLRQQHVV